MANLWHNAHSAVPRTDCHASAGRIIISLLSLLGSAILAFNRRPWLHNFPSLFSIPFLLNLFHLFHFTSLFDFKTHCSLILFLQHSICLYFFLFFWSVASIKIDVNRSCCCCCDRTEAQQIRFLFIDLSFIENMNLLAVLHNKQVYCYTANMIPIWKWGLF